ncbi:cadmium resistance transporter [Microbispora sp. H10830]|uniref:cadmium resistance transporter n=1 Tax=Microbispora sp. H10830 TaxID=2729109 RepID=UPI0015FED713|nr:cadmium resistance transporter [Microbispora sp. H10830]
MDGIAATLGTACAVFAGTNVDDVVILTVLFLSARAKGRPRPWQIVTGQYAGIAALVVVSGVAALGLAVIPDRWVGLLGLVPLALGVRGLVAALRASGGDDPPSAPVATGVLSVASITVANGADNVSVYTPLFRTIGPAATLLTVVVFAVLVAVWCAAGSWLGSHKKVVEFAERFGHWLVPLVFVGIGALIVLESGVVGRLIALL